MGDVKVCPASELPAGSIKGVGRWAVGNTGDEYFAVTRYCHHLCADLAKGSIDRRGQLVCPWHGARYDVNTGRMDRGPQGVFVRLRVSGLAKAATRLLPLGRAQVLERDGTLYVTREKRRRTPA
jgi:nitrite reductase/ring-hydroxylating ferredoxin subunit